MDIRKFDDIPSGRELADQQHQENRRFDRCLPVQHGRGDIPELARGQPREQCEDQQNQHREQEGKRTSEQAAAEDEQ
ncbi:hypothetical protein D3C75_1040260 [compost metagenome]